MEVAVLREKLHEYINVADEQHLSAIFVLVGDNVMEATNEKYDQATLDKFYQARENHLNGTSKSYTAEEAMSIIRQHKK